VRQQILTTAADYIAKLGFSGFKEKSYIHQIFMGNYIFLLLVLASFFGLSKLFKKAGVEGWKGWIPIYNFYILAKLLDKP